MEAKPLPPLWLSGLGGCPPLLVAKIVKAQPNLMFLPKLPPTILAQRFVAESESPAGLPLPDIIPVSALLAGVQTPPMPLGNLAQRLTPPAVPRGLGCHPNRSQ